MKKTQLTKVLLISVVFCSFIILDSLFAQNQTPEVVVQMEHTNAVTSVYFSPDMKYILSESRDNLYESSDNTIKLWEISTGKVVKSFPGYIVDISPDWKYILTSNGSWFVSGRGREIMKLWDISSGKEIKTFPKCAFAFSPDWKYILTVNKNDLVLWDIKSGEKVHTFLGHTSWVESIAFSQDGLYALSGSYDKTIKLWSVNWGEELKTFTGHSDGITSVAFSRDGNYILSGSEDKTLKFWDINSGKEIRTFTGHNELISSVTFSPNGKYALSESKNFQFEEKTLKLWDIESGKEIKTFTDYIISSSTNKKYIVYNKGNASCIWDLYEGKELQTLLGQIDKISSIAFSPNGNYVISCRDSTLKLWDMNSGINIKTFDGLNTVAFSPDNNNVLSGSGNNTLRLLDINSGKEVKTFSGYKFYNVSSVAFSPDERYVLSGGEHLKLWDLKFGKGVKTLSDTFWVSCVAFSPDGKHALAGCIIDFFQAIELWNIKSESMVKRIYGNENREKIDNLIYSPDGKYFVSSSFDRGSLYWELNSGQVVHSFENIRNPSAFTPDLKFGLTWDGEGNAIFLDVDSEEELKTCFADTAGFFTTSSAISPNGKYALTASYRALMLWNINSTRMLKSLYGHTDLITTLAFSPNSKYALSGSNDMTLKLWNAKTGSEVKTFSGHTGAVTSAIFSSSGKNILSVGMDNKMKLWNVESGNEIVSMISFGNKDYLYITPDNYYLCSKNGLKTIAFVIDNHAFPSEQFDLQYNRPDIVLERIGLAPKELIEAYRKAYEKRLKKMKFDEGMFNKDFHMPEMKILDENIPMTTTEKNINLKIKAEDSKYMLDRINVYVNDVPIYGTDGIDLRDKKTSNYESDIKLELSNGKNKVQVSVLNDKGVESLKETFDVSYEAPEVKHDLYVVAIGASDYNDSRYKLNFAAKDAKDIGDLFLNQKDKYNDVKVLKLLDKDVTKENILKAKEFLMQSKVDDEVIVFIGGHGLLTKDFDYYFATADIDFTNPQSRGVTFEEIEGLLDGIPARQKILLMDTCHSGELDKEDLQIIAQNEKQVEHGEVIFRDVPGVRIGRKNENEGLGLKNTSELMQEMFVDLRRGSGAAVISSSGGLEVSFEGGGIKNGFFTYCIIEGLKTQNADLNKDGKITISELRDYVSDKVEKLTKGTQKPTSRKENIENDFRVW